ncbi:MAG TPA: HU family DNA-binding protein [bacterium]|nr:HU family DNA-binding protein [bacterium]
MNKAELIEAVASDAGLTKKDAAAAVDAVFGNIVKSLKKKQTVQLVGFGTFLVAQRKARSGVNPATKEKIKIKAAKVPKFKPGKALKDAVN